MDSHVNSNGGNVAPPSRKEEPLAEAMRNKNPNADRSFAFYMYLEWNTEELYRKSKSKKDFYEWRKDRIEDYLLNHFADHCKRLSKEKL